MARLREVLFNKKFFPLWAGQIISEFGDRLNQMALLALVYSKSPGSVMAVANLLFFIIIPVFAIGPLAGVYIDRWDRKKIMVISDIVRGILILVGISGIIDIIGGTLLLQQKKSGKIITYISAIFRFMNVPIGTIYAIGAFWILSKPETDQILQ